MPDLVSPAAGDCFAARNRMRNFAARRDVACRDIEPKGAGYASKVDGGTSAGRADGGRSR